MVCRMYMALLLMIGSFEEDTFTFEMKDCMLEVWNASLMSLENAGSSV